MKFLTTLVILMVNIHTGFSEETTPLINEVMSSNASTIQDEDGDYSDWIEIYNPGDSPIDLAGYGLSDRADDPFKWVFPSCIINPGQYLLVFASGKDRKTYVNHRETIIDKGDEWKYIIPDSELPENWNTTDFDDSGWKSGPSDFGFGYEAQATTFPRTISFFLRKSFTVDDITSIIRGIIQIDYEDGFVAYLNGNEVARANIGEVDVPPSYDQIAKSKRKAEMYDGGNPEFFQIDDIQSHLVQGKNVLAIQVHNCFFLSNEMTAIPFLTFGMPHTPPNPRGAPGILKLSLNNFLFLHTNFKINSQGETLVLTDDSGAICDQVERGAIPIEYSLGRQPDGETQWVFFEQSTPGESNSIPGFAGYANPVQASIPGGFYNSTLSIELSVNSPSAEIRYTLDGSAPADSSALYYTSIPVESTTVLRAQAFEAGLFPGNILTHTYFINQTSTLPVISLSTAPANFFDDEIGIYGIDDKYGTGQYNTNFLEDWERPVHMEFYEPDGSPAFNVDAGIKISGLFTRLKPQKPFRIFLRRKYGDTKIKYQIFPDLPITEFNRLDLRNGGDDAPSTHFQDGMIHSLVKDKNVDIQAFRPCVVYINGDYWGIYNIRERLDEDYAASHHSIDPDNIDFLRFSHARIGLEIVRGDSIHYYAMIDYMEKHDLSVPANYEYVETQIDVNNFIDFNITEIYSANSNYLIDTDRIWRPKTPDGKWRWMLSDLDAGFPFSGEIVDGIKQDYTFNVFGFLTGHTVDTYKMRYVRAFILRKLLENTSFKHNFINLFADYLNTIFSPDTVIQRINEIKALLEPEMLAHIRRWEGYYSSGPYIGTSRSDWYNNVDGTIEFAENRPEHVRSQIIEHFNLSGTVNVDLDISQSGGGKIKINSLFIEDYPWNGIYFKDVPIQVAALPDLGYRFVGWTGVTPEESPSLDITLTDDISVAAVFEKIGDDIVLDRYH
ncbi:MAG: hypothetical protein HOC71_14585, partial [Candidatus Latescibacteria bacterium]|nr:hypothetical protein [Candidatus Latescibacterota bacterium]